VNFSSQMPCGGDIVLIDDVIGIMRIQNTFLIPPSMLLSVGRARINLLLSMSPRLGDPTGGPRSWRKLRYLELSLR
jgi:hypothetical protein